MAHILAVDDSQAIRLMVQSVLEKEGHKVTSAESGIDALGVARENSVDLIITDLNMPNMGGMALVGHLRKIDNHRFTPILIMTTEHSDFLKAKAKSAGASGWIKKPVDEERLLRAVDKTLNR
ncbi:response regulator [Methylophaga sp. 42_8_T64]|nr:response regulator [Methylophaga sp. 42_8_T64]